jgi:sialidase-1
MRDGTLVFPAQFKDEKEMPYATIIYSKDRGNSWQIGTGAKSNTT